MLMHENEVAMIPLKPVTWIVQYFIIHAVLLYGTIAIIYSKAVLSSTLCSVPF